MLKIYGSPLCPDCRNCRLNFDRHGIAYESVDILGSLSALKAFLKMRDTDPVFEGPRGRGDIGIPALVREDGTVFTDWEGYLGERGLDVVYEPAAGGACGLDRRNC